MKTKKLSHLQIFVRTIVFEIFVIEGPDAISTYELSKRRKTIFQESQKLKSRNVMNKQYV